MSFNVSKFKKLGLVNYEINATVSECTTFKIGGRCLAIVYISNLKELKKILKFCLKNKIKYFILGCGSNVLFSDSGFNGIVITFTGCFSKVKVKRKKNFTKLNVEAGLRLSKLNLFCGQNGFSGLEWSCGIPASVGGAIYSNAGSYEFSIGDIIKNVKVIYPAKLLGIDFLKIRRLSSKKCNFKYRNSVFKNKKYIIVSANLLLKNKSSEQVKKTMQQYLNLKKQNQPLGTKNAGCIFKNGENYKIAKLIDSLNLKGKSIGDAQISTKHCGFIVNNSKATCQNVKDLIKYIQIKVQKEYGVKPVLEIELIEEGD